MKLRSTSQGRMQERPTSSWQLTGHIFKDSNHVIKCIASVNNRLAWLGTLGIAVWYPRSLRCVSEGGYHGCIVTGRVPIASY